jgi:hypothetical protein
MAINEAAGLCAIELEDRILAYARTASRKPLLVSGARDAFMSEVPRRFSPPKEEAAEDPLSLEGDGEENFNRVPASDVVGLCRRTETQTSHGNLPGSVICNWQTGDILIGRLQWKVG